MNDVQSDDLDADIARMTDEELLVGLRIEIRKIQEHIALQDDLLSYAWTIIANAGCGATHKGEIGWDNEAPDWHLAAITWRDRYHELIKG